MPSKTAGHELPYPEPADTADVPRDIKALAEKVNTELDKIAPKQIVGPTKKQLLIANASGIVTAVTASGDVTNDESGVFTIGNEKVDTARLKNLAVSTGKLENKAVTDAKLANPLTRGAVTALGAAEVGTGYSVEHLGTGSYEIHLEPELSTTGIMVATLIAEIGFIKVSAPSKKSFAITTYNSSAVLTNQRFAFIVQGT